MREILFRGKFGNEWKYGFLSIEPKGLVIKEPYKNDSTNVWHIDSDTVGQYTGFTDNNGAKIFEGDICSFGDTDGEITNYEVSWLDNKWLGSGWIVNSWIVKECGYSGVDNLDIFFCKLSVVIGNIYDNPELLKGVK